MIKTAHNVIWIIYEIFLCSKQSFLPFITYLLLSANNVCYYYAKIYRRLDSLFYNIELILNKIKITWLQNKIL